MFAGDTTEIRTIEWTAKGYEGAFTQYTIVPTNPNGSMPGYADLYITQIATRDNLARALTPVEQEKKFGPIKVMREGVDVLIKNHTEYGDAKEI